MNALNSGTGGDTMIGFMRKEGLVLLTPVERLIRYTAILKIEGKAEVVDWSIITSLPD